MPFMGGIAKAGNFLHSISAEGISKSLVLLFLLSVDTRSAALFMS